MCQERVGRPAGVTYRTLEERDLEGACRIYTHLWCNWLLREDATDDATLCAGLSVVSSLCRSCIQDVAVLDGRVVGVCLGGLVRDGRVVPAEAWRPRYDELLELGRSRAETAGTDLEGALFGDLREHAAADEFIASGSPYAQAELNYITVDPEFQHGGIGMRLLREMLRKFRAAGAGRFFLMTDSESDYGFYEHLGMVRVLERPDGPSWASYVYGGETGLSVR